jgi:hypothetical protein
MAAWWPGLLPVERNRACGAGVSAPVPPNHCRRPRPMQMRDSPDTPAFLITSLPRPRCCHSGVLPGALTTLRAGWCRAIPCQFRGDVRRPLSRRGVMRLRVSMRQGLDVRLQSRLARPCRHRSRRLRRRAKQRVDPSAITSKVEQGGPLQLAQPRSQRRQVPVRAEREVRAIDRIAPDPSRVQQPLSRVDAAHVHPLAATPRLGSQPPSGRPKLPFRAAADERQSNSAHGTARSSRPSWATRATR